MKTTFTGRSSLSLLLCLTGLLFIATPKARADQGDPPTRVARISYVDGSVSMQPGGSGDWGAAATNRPVTIGDKIWSDKDSRAELQAGQAAIHLGGMTALSFLNLDENIIQMRLAEGSVNFRVRELRQGDLYEVDAPNLAFTVKQAGAFRIDVNENGDSSRVTVIRGEGVVTAGGKTYEVHGGERAEFNGAENPEYNISQAPGPDGLDKWAEERDLKEDNSVSAKYVSREVPGYSDLDDYGDWRDEPEYGHVWYPRYVDVGWAPYSVGYWNWVGPWGWSWVDTEPWGFAPFHYGRWNYFGGGWGWCPGPFFGPPIYGPAFVGFFGGGSFGFGFGFGGGIGWFPLGFGEPFFPGFRCSRGFIERVNVRNTFIRNTNIINTTNIHNFNFVNAHNPSAVTAASRNNFVNGQAINRGAVHVTAASLKGAQMSNRASFTPTKQSAIGAANARAHVATPPSAIQNRSVMARTAPSSAASHSPVRTINTSRLAVGRTGNAPANNTMSHPQNGAMNQRASSSNAPANVGRSTTMPNNEASASWPITGRPQRCKTCHAHRAIPLAATRRSAPRMARAPGRRRATQRTEARLRRASGAPTVQLAAPLRAHARTSPIVRHGRAVLKSAARALAHRAASTVRRMVPLHGRERLPSMAIERHRQQTTAPMRRRSVHLLRTATEATHRKGPTPRRRDLTPPRAAAIRRPLAPTRRRAGVTPPQAAATAAVAVVAAATAAVEVATMVAEAVAVAVATMAVVEVAAALMAAVGAVVAALMAVVVAEAARLPTLITRF